MNAALIVLNLLALAALAGGVGLALFWGVEARARQERTARNIGAVCERLSEAELNLTKLQGAVDQIETLDDAAIVKAARGAVVYALRCAEDTLTHANDSEAKGIGQ